MCDCCDDNLTNLNTGNDGQSAYLYIIYADDLIGTDAQLTVPTCFQAFVNSNVSMTNQEAIDYAIDNELFYDRCGDSGSSGSQGPVGPVGPKGDAGDPACNPLAEISLRFDGGEEEDLVINFDQDGTECEQTFTGTVFPGNFAGSSFFAEVLNSSQFENGVATAVDNAIDGVLNVTPTSVPVTISTGSSTLLQYESSGNGTDPAPILSIFTSAGPSWFYYYIIGNQMTIQFRFVLFSDYSGYIKLHVKIPANKTSLLGTGTPIMMNRGPIDEWKVPQISDASDVGAGWLRINDRYDNSSTFRFWVPQSVAPSTAPIIIAGTYTFLIN